MKKVTEYIDRLIEGGIPYLDVAVRREHEELFRYGNGKAPVTGEERLFMYSCTKPMTVACTMRLIEEGKLALTSAVEDILPAYRGVYLQGENGERRAPRTKITVCHLLTMSAGLSYSTGYYPIFRALDERGDKAPTRAVIDALPESPLLFEPGSRFQYSLCHDVLGAVIAEVAGMPFSDYMRRRFLAPLGMESTHFASPRDEGVAALYEASEDGQIRPVEKHNTFIFAEGYESGGAGLISTVSDYARFADMLAAGGVGAGGERLLGADSLAAMQQPAFHSIRVDSGFSCVQGDVYAYGLGVRTRTVATDWGLPVGEFGWDGAAGSYIMSDPVNKISVTVGMHVLNWPAVFTGEHLEIVRRVYEELNA